MTRAPATMTNTRTTMPAREPETHVYDVILASGEPREVIAAYYLVEDGRVTFKDTDHQAVYSVPSATAHEIVRRPNAPEHSSVDDAMRAITDGTMTRDQARKVFSQNATGPRTER